MARMRFIKPGFFLNDELAALPPLARLLFAGLWTVADREGRLADRPRRIKAEVLPYDDADVDHLLSLLHEAGFIVRYGDESERYIAVSGWAKHQSPHIKEQESRIPPPSAEPGSTTPPSAPPAETGGVSAAYRAVNLD